MPVREAPRMPRHHFLPLLLVLASCFSAGLPAEVPDGAPVPRPPWPQWRGPTRDGRVLGPAWPDRLDADTLRRLWRVPLGPGYSGPVVSDRLVFTAETVDKESEVVRALDRKTGAERWRAEWKGALSVPFFAASHGSWIRATPAFDGECLYVAGMRDVLVCLEAATGRERWRVDIVDRFKTPLPAFGFVSSPLVDGDAVFVQAGASVARLDSQTGEVRWRTLQDGGGMYGSAFSSPILADLCGVRQLVVQTRTTLAGVDVGTGAVLWSQPVPSYNGMNILTPVVEGDAVFTSSYRNKSWLFRVSREGGRFRVAEAWSADGPGYMSTPVVIDGHAYLHLQSQRVACIDLRTGAKTWTSAPFGKYWSLVAHGDRILALDADGTLFGLRASPKAFDLIGRQKVGEQETWAHLAVSGDELFVRELGALSAWRWSPPRAP